MTPQDVENRVAQTLEAFLLRRQQGETPDPQEYSAELGDAYEDFLNVLDIESVLDDLLEPPFEEVLPARFGPYTLLRELGRGASGIVYEAVHDDLGRREAVKVLRAGSDADSKAWHRFRQEAKTLARIRHDNVVQIYGAGQVDGRPYFAMALLEGDPLDSLIKEDRVPPPRELAAGLAGIADGLQTLHDAGMVHRDVKPSNIVLLEDGTMVLADFGLARSLSGSDFTQTGQALGTPLFMSPEQILGKGDQIGACTDVYGLGATLYDLLARRPLFDTEDLHVLVRRVLNDRPTSLRRLVPDVPPGLADVAMTAVEKRREDRYATAGEMGEDLRAFAEGRAVHGRPISPLQRGVRRMRRWWIPLAAVLALTVGAWIWYASRPATLEINTYDVARVHVDDTFRGTGSMALEVPAGTRHVRIEHPLFHTGEYEVPLEPGEDEAVTGKLRAKDPDDPEAYRIIMDWIGRPDRRFAKGARTRGLWKAPDAVATPSAPLGRVRRGDLAVYRVVLSMAYDYDGDVVFRRGDEELYRVPLDGDDLMLWHEAPLPDEVRSVLAPGDVVTWGVVGEDDAYEHLATFEVVPEDGDLEAELARLETELEGNPAYAALVAGRALIERGLAFAAYEKGRALVQVLPRAYESDSFVPLALMLEARQAMAPTVKADVEAITTAIDAFPPEVQDAWFAPPLEHGHDDK